MGIHLCSLSPVWQHSTHETSVSADVDDLSKISLICSAFWKVSVRSPTLQLGTHRYPLGFLGSPADLLSHGQDGPAGAASCWICCSPGTATLLQGTLVHKQQLVAGAICNCVTQAEGSTPELGLVRDVRCVRLQGNYNQGDSCFPYAILKQNIPSPEIKTLHSYSFHKLLEYLALFTN